MTEELIERILSRIDERIDKSNEVTTKKYTNGCIENLRKENEQQHYEMRKMITDNNIRHEVDMKRITPALEAFEVSINATRYGRALISVILWIAGVIVAIGSAVLVIRTIYG